MQRSESWRAGVKQNTPTSKNAGLNILKKGTKSEAFPRRKPNGGLGPPLIKCRAGARSVVDRDTARRRTWLRPKRADGSVGRLRRRDRRRPNRPRRKKLPARANAAGI